MKLSLNWLKDYVDLPADPHQVADLITAHVAEVEHVSGQAEALSDIVIGKILEIKPHPNADKLVLCSVELGSEVKQVVCGGSNLVVNHFVAVAKPGARVRWHGEGDLVTLQETKIRGEKSFGMICAAVELGLEQLFSATSEREILDLSAIMPTLAQPSGAPLAEVLGLNDSIIEIDNKTLTHRPDLFCQIGFARELSVILNQPLKLKALRQFEAGTSLPLTVNVEAPELCRRYIGAAVQNVTVKPSPDWLQRRLYSVGLRPINNVVDITNYVMYEYGQPLHAFDYAKLADHTITVRMAKDKETITTLDGKPHELTNTMLVIADATTPQAVAGIMGGASSEITNTTTAVVIESANFAPTSIRLAAQALAIRTDGSTRHEKNLPLVFPEYGMWRALELLEELAGGEVASEIIDVRSNTPVKSPIELSLQYVNQLIGTPIEASRVQQILTQLGCTVVDHTDTLLVTAPAHRSDLLIAEELIEEVARIYGYSNITPQPLTGTLSPQVFEPELLLGSKLTQWCADAGVTEMCNYSFYSLATAQRFGMTADHITMLNPMNPDQQLLRQSLRPNVLLAVERNLDRGERDFSVMEYGHVYLATGERKYFTIACAGSNQQVYRQAKGVIGLLSQKLGQVIPANFALDQVGQWWVATAEVDVTALALVPSVNPKFTPIPEFPGIDLDISIELSTQHIWSDVAKVITQVGQGIITDLSVFDVYEGKNLPTGTRALGIRMHLQKPDRTLTMDEAEQLRNTVVSALETKFQAKHRV